MPRSAGLGISIVALAACTGQIGEAVPRSGAAPETTAQSCTDGQTGVPTPAPLRRLSHREYQRTLEAITGVDPAPFMQGFSLERSKFSFDIEAELQPVVQSQTQAYRTAAEAMADATLAAPNRDAFVGCDPGTASCVRAFTARFGRLAFRRALTQTEQEALFTLATGESDPWMGLRLVVSSILQSVSFLYRIEVGSTETSERPGLAQLDGPEVATRLSFLLWGEGPDEPLLALADDGTLDSSAGVVSTASAMLSDPRAERQMRDMFRQWLAAQFLHEQRRDVERYPEFSEALLESMEEELLRFAAGHGWDEGTSFLDAFTDSETEIDANLAAIYRVESPQGAGMSSFDLADADERGGILSLAAWLTVSGGNRNEPSIVSRGHMIKEVFLCEPIPPPPPDVEAAVPREGESPLDVANRHKTDPRCVGCHHQMDPIGEGLEIYDALGRVRDAFEDGQPLPSGGSISTVDGSEFHGAAELGRVLRDAEASRRCVAKHVWRWVTARAMDADDEVDACTLEHFSEALERNDFNLRGTLLELVGSDAFRFRPTVEAVTE